MIDNRLETKNAILENIEKIRESFPVSRGNHFSFTYYPNGKSNFPNGFQVFFKPFFPTVGKTVGYFSPTFLHHTFYICYTKIFIFFTPKILNFYTNCFTPNFLHFLQPNFYIFRPIFLQQILHFLHQNLYIFRPIFVHPI